MWQLQQINPCRSNWYLQYTQGLHQTEGLKCTKDGIVNSRRGRLQGRQSSDISYGKKIEWGSWIMKSAVVCFHAVGVNIACPLLSPHLLVMRRTSSTPSRLPPVICHGPTACGHLTMIVFEATPVHRAQQPHNTSLSHILLSPLSKKHNSLLQTLSMPPPPKTATHTHTHQWLQWMGLPTAAMSPQAVAKIKMANLPMAPGAGLQPYVSGASVKLVFGVGWVVGEGGQGEGGLPNKDSCSRSYLAYNMSLNSLLQWATAWWWNQNSVHSTCARVKLPQVNLGVPIVFWPRIKY